MCELEQGVAIAATRLPQHSILLDAGGTQDPRDVLSHLVGPGHSGLQAYPDQARQRGEEGVALAQQLAHPFNLTVVFNQWLRLQHSCRTLHLPLAVERAETSRRLATEHGFVQQMANETYRQGLLLAAAGAAYGRDCPDAAGLAGLPCHRGTTCASPCIWRR